MAAITSFRLHTSKLLKLGLPLVGANVAGFSIHMTDTIMLGWYSVTSLAASTVATSLWFILFIIGAGFGRAVTPMVAEAIELGDETRARRVTRMALWLSAIYAALLIPVLMFGEQILLLMGQEAVVAQQGGLYLQIAVLGMFPAMAAQVMRSYLGALELTAVQLWITLAALVANAVVNYALIFGNLGAPELGIAGAAIASIVVQLVQMIALMIYVQLKKPEAELFRRIWKSDNEAMRQVFRLGLPIGLTSFAEGGLFAGSSVMMGWIGEVELAAHGIALQLTAFMFMFHVGMAEAATIRSSRHYGARNEGELRRGAKTAYAVSLSFGVLVVAVFLAVPATLVGWFIDPTDPARDAVLALGVVLLMLSALFQFVDAAQIVALSVLRGVQDTRVPMWLACLSYWVIGIPASYVMAFPLGWGAQGLWLGLTVGLGVAAVLLSARFWGRDHV
ncbi:MATE family efflux transporter [Pseudooctadecabacter jejudonensis]|uniref:Multidrug-efflux transporter n=1 Tax=Pseudooctadecabacter jejudonensis TaxID=1391910 RepID=A0A1Y5RP84_9RHOB|nr:MATE family efflux transporter [Pseudooctadecabacter jejudonensis]SLN21808.1 Multidrug resistance protein NorM [Pseudooctadecabacter jejudonensis]